MEDARPCPRTRRDAPYRQHGKIIVDYISRQEINFDRFWRMTESEDNEFIRERVYELLPEGWSKVGQEKAKV
jgi:hypothetical protein